MGEEPCYISYQHSPLWNLPEVKPGYPAYFLRARMERRNVQSCDSEFSITNWQFGIQDKGCIKLRSVPVTWQVGFSSAVIRNIFS